MLRKLAIHIPKNKIWPWFYTALMINLLCIKDLHVRPENVKLLDENIWEKLHDIGIGNDFLDMTSKVQAAKAEVEKWDYNTL